MSVAIETERLSLRSWRDGDREQFEVALNTPAVTRYLGGLQPASEIADAIERMRRCEAEHGYCFWAVERAADTTFLGFCGIKPMTAQGAPEPVASGIEIGWRLREDAWGKGYAREAASATLAAAFGRFGIDTVWAITMPANRRSWGLMRRLGMVERADLAFDMPIHGPHVVYELEQARWTG